MLEDYPCLLPNIPDLVILPAGKQFRELRMAHFRSTFSSQGLSSKALELLEIKD